MDRREHNHLATQKHIQSTLLAMMGEGKPLHQISTTQLCQRCGIAKSTFYLYFPDKYAVIEEIIAKVSQDLKNINASFEKYSISDLISGKPTPIARNMVRYLSENRETLKVLFGPTGVPDFMNTRNKNDIEGKYVELYHALHLNPKHEKLTSFQFFSGVIGLFRFYLFENDRYDDEEMAVIFGNMLRNSLSIADHIR